VTWLDKLLAALSAIATGSINFTTRVWHDLSIAIRRDAAILNTGRDPGAAAFANLDSLKPSDMVALLSGAIEKLIAAEFDVSGAAFKPLTSALLNVHRKTLDTLKDVRPGDEVTAANTLLDEAIGAGVGAHIAAAYCESLYPTKQLGLPPTAALMAELSGFREIMTGIIEPEMMALVTKPHTYQTNLRARSTLPNERAAMDMFSRRVIGDAAASLLLGYAGLSTDYVDAVKAASYRPVQPRALATMFIDTPFPRDTVKELLEYAGYRDVDVATMLTAFEYNSLKNVRGDYLAALLNAAERGAIDAPTLDSDLDGLNFSTPAKNFVHLTVAVKRLVQLEELYRKSVSIGYRTGQVTDAQYVPLLQAAGIGAADAQAHYDIDSEIVRGKALLADEREAQKEAEKLAALNLATARESFLKGQIDAIAMTSAVAVSGIPANLVPSTVALITAQGAARQVHIYGLLLNPDQAALLKEKVAAVKEQVLKKILTIAAASATLDSFNLPPANRDALLAEWAAQALKIVLPV